MTPDAVMRLLREGLLVILTLSAAPLLVALLTGFFLALLQATTQLQENTISFVPKLLAVLLTLALLGPWMMRTCVNFTRMLFEAIPLIR